MKNILLLGFLFSFTIQSIAQVSAILPIKIELGKDNQTNNPFLADSYEFNQIIDNFYVDTTSHLITVQMHEFRNSFKSTNHGYIFVFDLNTNVVIWKKEVNWLQNRFIQDDSCLILKGQNRNQKLQVNSGNILWESPLNVIYLDDFNNKALAIDYQTKQLCGINLLNGQKQWQRNISNEFGWDEIKKINDSTLLLEGSGLHLINFKNGKGWDYNTITGDKNYSSAKEDFLGLASLLVGSLVLSSGEFLNGISSNLIRDSNDLLYASKIKLARINKKGEIVWYEYFKQDLMSNSELLIKDSLVILVNKGFAYYKGQPVKYGTPFIAAWDKYSGEKLYQSIFEDKKKQIRGIKLLKDSLLLLSQDMIKVLSPQNGHLLSLKTYSIDSLGELYTFLDAAYYLKTDTSFIRFGDNNNILSLTSKGLVILLDSNLNIKNIIPLDQLFTVSYRYDKFIIMTNGNDSFIVTDGFNIIGKFKFNSSTQFIGSRIFYKTNTRLIIFDLNTFKKN